MDDPRVYLEKLSAFSRLLRREGLIVSHQETADAGQILIHLGMTDRNQVKTALRTVYAKSREDQLTFDRVFDGFFLSEEAIRAQAEASRKEQQKLEQMRRQAQEELSFNGDALDLSQEQKDTYATMPQEARDRLQRIADKYKGNLERNPELYSNLIHSVFARAILEQQMLLEDAALGAQALDPEMGMLYKDIGQFKDTEIPKAISIIQTISRQINGELSAKRKGSGHGAKLDFRRTIRKGLETGGSLSRLRYRRKRQRRRQLVMLCDVSGSMVQFSEFALRFIQSLNQVSESSRTFLFSETMVEADTFSLQNMDLFRGYVKESGVFGRGTVLGAAWQKLTAMQPKALNTATTLLILSDTKTIDQNKAAAALQEAKRQAGRVIWLNPIPENKWKYIRSVQTMAAICPMVSCNTLSALASACRKLAGG